MKLIRSLIHLLFGCVWQEGIGQFGHERHCVHCGRVEYKVLLGRCWNHRVVWRCEPQYDYIRETLRRNKVKAREAR